MSEGARSREGRLLPNDKNIDQKLRLVSVQRSLTAPQRLADLHRGDASCGCMPHRYPARDRSWTIA